MERLRRELSRTANFTNLSRYSNLSERTYRRHYRQSLGFVEFNQHTIVQAVGVTADSIAAIDCSFVPNSGKTTYGLDWFYNGSASRSKTGLEISVIAVIDVSARRGYTLSVQQTPPTPVSPNPQTKGKGKGKNKGRQTVSRQTIEQVRQFLKHLPEKPEATPMSEPSFQPEHTRVDYYLNQLKATHPHLRLKAGSYFSFSSCRLCIYNIQQQRVHSPKGVTDSCNCFYYNLYDHRYSL